LIFSSLYRHLANNAATTTSQIAVLNEWVTLSFVKTKVWNHGLKPKFYLNS